MSGSAVKHCRRFRWASGDCGMLACLRCGKDAFKRLSARIVGAACRRRSVLFVTFYFDARYWQDLAGLPLFERESGHREQVFRVYLSKIFRALRDKARREGFDFQYVLVLALGKVKHKLHKNIHSHALVTWLPETRQRKNSRRPERLECPWMDKKLAKLHMIAWVEKPRSVAAVARYTAKNAKTVIGKTEYKNVRIYRFSEGFEK